MERDRVRMLVLIQILAILIASIGGLAVLGHAVNLPLLYTWGSQQVAGMAVATAILFIAGGMALLGLVSLIEK